jgi:hypothetical protein
MSSLLQAILPPPYHLINVFLQIANKLGYQKKKKTPQAIWPIAKSLTNRDGPRAPTAIHGLLGLEYHPEHKANAIADCLENQFTPHDLCDENHERRVEARVQALFKAADNNPHIE